MFRVQSGGRLLRRPEREQPKKTEGHVVTASAPTPNAPLLPAPSAPEPRPQLTSADQTGVLTLSPQEARELLRRGETPKALVVQGSLNLSGSAWLRTLPDWLRCAALMVDDCPHLSVLPSDLHAEKLSARRCPNIRELDGRLSIRETVNLTGSGVQRIHADLHANRLQVAQCRELTVIRGMVSVAHLDVRGCTNLSRLEPTVHVTQTLDVADSGLNAMPGHVRAGLRWNGVPVDARVAFNPESLNGREVMQIRNVQHRRVLLDRLGIEKFLADVGGLVLDLARRSPAIEATGIELAPLPWLASRLRARLARSRARFIRGDYNGLNFGEFDLVFAYLSPAAMDALWRKAAREMRPGSRLLSYEFNIDDRSPDRIVYPTEGGPALHIWHF